MQIQHNKGAESKQNKQEVSHTVSLPFKLVFSGFSIWATPVPLLAYFGDFQSFENKILYRDSNSRQRCRRSACRPLDRRRQHHVTSKRLLNFTTWIVAEFNILLFYQKTVSNIR